MTVAVSGQKRFIAGAVCPSCNQMDTVVVYRDGDEQMRECVRCGFCEGVAWDRPPAAGLPTRVDRTAAGEDVEIVRILVPGSDRKH